jgi:Uma2 family endonuclease
MAVPVQELKRIPMTIEEFKKLPEGPPYYDYVRGEAIELNKPTGRHSHIQIRVGNLLYEHVKAHQLGVLYGEIDVELIPDLWFGPDLVYLSEEHRDRYDEASGDLHGVPDLIVEITSPSTAAYDRVGKFSDYYDAGVPWYWIVDQDSLTIEEYQWTQGGYVRAASVGAGQVFRPRLFAGLEINLQVLL